MVGRMFETSAVHIRTSFLSHDVWGLSGSARILWFTMLFLADADGEIRTSCDQIASLARLLPDQQGVIDMSGFEELAEAGELDSSTGGGVQALALQPLGCSPSDQGHGCRRHEAS